MRTLTDKQERFVHEYLIDHNASAAARRAGYAPGNRRAQGAELMQNALVRERIGTEMGALFADLKINAREIMREQARVAFFRPLRMFGADGRALPLGQLPPEIAEVLTIHYDDKDGKQLLRVRQPSRLAALSALDRRLQAWLKTQLAPLPVLEEAAQARTAPVFDPAAIVLDYDRIEEAKKAAQAGDMGQIQAGGAAVQEGSAQITPVQAVPTEAAPPTPAGQTAAVLAARAQAEQAAPAMQATTAALPEAAPGAVPAPRNTAPAVVPAAPATPDPALCAEGQAAVAAAVAAAAPAAALVAQAIPTAQATLVVPAIPATPAAPPPKKRSGLDKALAHAARTLKKKLGPAPRPAAPDPQAPPPLPRRDPELLWGGKRPPTPEPEPHPLIEQHLAEVRAAQQRAELFGKFGNPNERIRPGMPQRPPGADLGYNPPHLRGRNSRPQYAIGAGECSFDGYDED